MPVFQTQSLLPVRPLQASMKVVNATKLLPMTNELDIVIKLTHFAYLGFDFKSELNRSLGWR